MLNDALPVYARILIRNLFFLCLGLLLSHSLLAQDSKLRAAHWYFGQGYGLDFTTGSPELDASSVMWTYEAACTMSDKFGELLYYTNGGGREDGTANGFIWNRNHEPMEGGELKGDKGGGYSAAQGCITFEKPGHPGTYCLFTVDEKETIQNPDNSFPQGKGCSYFEIDMKANNGLGRVTISDQKLLAPAFEFISATKHGNCVDYWVIVPTGHYQLQWDYSLADSFYVFLVNENGVQAPQIFPMPEGDILDPDEYGIIKIAPNGSRFTCGSFMYNFDNRTGVISDPINLGQDYDMVLDDPLCFSANSQFLYRFRRETWDTMTLMTVVQYDLLQPDPPSDAISIGSQTFHGIVVYGTPQLGPDGRIYMLIQQGGYTQPTIVPTIQNPNIRGPDAGFEGASLYITNGDIDVRFLRFGNYTDHLFAFEPSLEVDAGPDIHLACNDNDGAVLYAPTGLDCYLWSNGEQADSIWVNEAGVYWVEIIHDCEMGVDSIEVFVDERLEGVALGMDTMLCDSEKLLLDIALNDVTYLWQDSSITPDYIVNTPGLYWVEVRRDDCFSRDSIVVTYQDSPSLSLPADMTLCEDDTVLVEVGAQPLGTSYRWSDGSVANQLYVNESGKYWVTASNACGSSSDEVHIDFLDCANIDCQIFVPNVFTPNGDGINDVLKVFADCDLEGYQLQVFNRWGALLFESKDPQMSWDGRVGGQLLNSGVLVYTLRYQVLIEGQWQWRYQHGDITLLH